MKIRTLNFLTVLVTVMVVIDALWLPAILSGARAFPAAFGTYVTPVAETLDMAELVFRIATMIVFSVWIYIAGRNLVEAGYEDLEFSPGSRIWWFAVPIANLFKPYQGMRELWNASHGSEAYDAGSGLVATWWALWLASGIVSYLVLATSTTGDTQSLWVASAIDVAVAVAAILLIHGIARAQRRLRGPDLEEVFA